MADVGEGFASVKTSEDARRSSVAAVEAASSLRESARNVASLADRASDSDMADIAAQSAATMTAVADNFVAVVDAVINDDVATLESSNAEMVSLSAEWVEIENRFGGLVADRCRQGVAGIEPQDVASTKPAVTEVHVAFETSSCRNIHGLKLLIITEQEPSLAIHQVDDWIDDNPDLFDEICLEWIRDLTHRELGLAEALLDAAAPHEDASGSYVRDTLSDAELVWCLNNSGFELLKDSAETLGIAPSAMANEISFIVSTNPSQALAPEGVGPLIEDSWQAWLALRPDYFIRSCQAAYTAFGGSAGS
jgi:hypothetical protein